MQAERQAQHAIDPAVAGAAAPGRVGGLRPALFAGYRDLASLRYDFPVVLVADGEAPVQSLSGLFDRALKAVAEGADGDRLRQHALRIERQIRALVAQGASGKLSALWDTAVSRLAAHNDELFQDSLRRVRAALKTDGELADCDRALPFRLLHHVWKTLSERKARAVAKDIDRLVAKLSDILTAEHVHDEQGLSADELQASMGASQHNAFDFAAMSRLLTGALPKMPLPESRRRRIEALILVLRSQRFFAASSGTATPYDFAFETCADAVAAYRERLPAMTELAKAMAIAELEVDGKYNGVRHDAFFETFGGAGLHPSELARFPDYLIRIGSDDVPDALKAFAAGVPGKVLVQTDDLLGPAGCEHMSFALGSRQLAGAAIGHSAFYVMQTTGSNLYRLRDRIARGLSYPGPALFSVFSGAAESASDLPPYLTAAAATESRAFPTFTYDPSAGRDLASRFCVRDNPGAEGDWPVQDFAYEDDDHQSACEKLAFTLADFVACDPRYAKLFTGVPRAKWNGHLAPVSEMIAAEDDMSEKSGYLLMVDRDNALHRVVVDDRLLREARHCADMWHGLQELGGINNSHAARLLERERKAWTEQAEREAQARSSVPAAAAEAPAAAVSAPAAPASEAAEPERSSDDPYIETARCTTCNECTQINDKMFTYDANKQASIANPDAGTYRQLVEAAENCQVSIIHPGKPRNPNESGLEELIKRAEPFL